MKPTKNNTFQIISGQYRGRKLRFADAKGLRPTPNKVRETLFNWLQFEITNQYCLDLFAGSGALGFEALSHGAKVVSVEKNLNAYQSIQKNAQILQTQNLQVIHANAFEFLAQNTQTFALILLDPPFYQTLIPKTLELLTNSSTPETKIYIESEFKIMQDSCKMPITILKQKQSGQVHYCLITLTGL